MTVRVPALPVQREAVQVRPADEHRVGAERQRLEGVAARADPGVEEHGHLVADRLDDRSERVERRDRPVDLTAAVVRDDDAVDLVLDGKPGVARALDPLEQDRAVPVRADERQLLPAQAGVLEDARERDAGRQRGDLCRHGHPALEDRVARVVRDALVLEEGRVPAVQVERPPAEQRRVERDDQVGVAGRLGTAQEGHGQLVVRGPVELVPARAVAVGRRHVLHLVGGLRRVDVRQPELGRRAGGGEVAVRMRERLHPDRREEDRRGHARPQDGGGEIDLRRLAALAPLDLPAPERRGVGARGVRVPRPGEDVGEGLGAQDLGGLRLELREVVGDGGCGRGLRHRWSVTGASRRCGTSPDPSITRP